MSITAAYLEKKPLGKRCYGSIGHLPNSRLGPSDSCVSKGQARICTIKPRDKHDQIIVQEKLDGSNVGVCKLHGEIIPLVRAGYRAETSPFKQHQIFAWWVKQDHIRILFDVILCEGERICGEWLAQAHGTIYYLAEAESPFFAFDIMRGDARVPFGEFCRRVDGLLPRPKTLWVHGPISVDRAMELHETHRHQCDSTEGVVYRVERKGKVDFLAKYVRPDKVDGKHLPSVTGKPAVWNWLPECGLDAFKGDA